RGFRRRHRNVPRGGRRLHRRGGMGDRAPDPFPGGAMNLPLACADFTFPLLPHDRSLDLIAALEMDGVDIGLFEGRSHLWPSREFERLPHSARDLRTKLEERGLRA